jgi:tetratricopeptide (TPR) repeat protein
MNKKKIYVILSILVILVTAFFVIGFWISNSKEDFVNFTPTAKNEFPMYGEKSYEDHVKNRGENLEKVDEEFIKYVFEQKPKSTKREASTELCYISFEYVNQYDYSTAIKRNNQAWLLDSSNPCVYAFYGYHYALNIGDIENSIKMYEKSLSLNPSDEDKIWIINDYAEVLLAYYDLDNTKVEYLKLAEEKINQSIKIEITPKTYRLLALYNYSIGNYDESLKNIDLAIKNGVPSSVMSSLKIKIFFDKIFK